MFLGMFVFEIHAKNMPLCVSVYAEFVFLGMFVFEIHAKNVSPSVFQFTRSLCSWECSCSRWESACMPWVSAPTSLLPLTGEFFYGVKANLYCPCTCWTSYFSLIFSRAIANSQSHYYLRLH